MVTPQSTSPVILTSGLQPHLGADSCGGLAQSQNGDVLGSVQPVDGQFGAGCPFHHSHVVLAGKAQRRDHTNMRHTGFLCKTKSTLIGPSQVI